MPEKGHKEHLRKRRFEFRTSDPDQQSAQPDLTPEQLWEGLVLRAEQPQLFVLGLDSCDILKRDGDTMERELHYGEAVVRDRLTLTPHDNVRYDILPTAEHVGGSLMMAIEDRMKRNCFCASPTAPPCPRKPIRRWTSFRRRKS